MRKEVPIGGQYRTGQQSPAYALYEWSHYADATFDPKPLENEQFIILQFGETFPPVHSCKKDAWWELVRYI